MMYRWPASALAAAGATAFLWAQSEVIRVDVNMVQVVATVRNPAGQLVGSLNKDDFEILDNGVSQQVAVLHRQTDQPLSVSLLIDTSGSTAKDLRYEVESASKFLNALLAEGHPEDAVSLFSFNYRVTEEKQFTRNYRSLEIALKSLQGEAGTAVYDAIHFGAQALETRNGRKAIVVVTDGGDTFSKYSLKQALETAQFANAVIYPIVILPITNDAGRNVGGENAMTIAAQNTGGRTFLPQLGVQLDRAFAEILSELRTQYLIGFYPKGAPLTKDRFHRLEVRTKSRELRVSARSGYYGEAEGGVAPPARTTVSPERRKNP